MSSHSILVSLVSNETSTINLIRKFFCMMSLLSCYALDSVFDFGFWLFDYNVSKCGAFSFYPSSSSLIHYASLTYILLVLMNFWKTLAPFSLIYISRMPIMSILVCFLVSHETLKFCSFFLIILSLSSSDWIILIDLSSSWLILFAMC